MRKFNAGHYTDFESHLLMRYFDLLKIQKFIYLTAYLSKLLYNSLVYGGACDIKCRKFTKNFF